MVWSSVYPLSSAALAINDLFFLKSNEKSDVSLATLVGHVDNARYIIIRLTRNLVFFAHRTIVGFCINGIHLYIDDCTGRRLA